MAIMMSKDVPFSFESEGLSAQFATLLLHWRKTGTIPPEAIVLLNDIIEDRPNPPRNPYEENNMLSLVASDAAKGVNIAQKYPRFFLRLLENQILLEDFLDILEVVFKSRRKQDILLPSPPSVDLSFLPVKKVSTLASVTIAAKTIAQTFLRESINQLNKRLLTPQQPTLVMRRVLSLPLDEDAWVTLLRQEVMVGQGRWLVRLEGTPDDQEPESLRLELGMVPVIDLEVMPQMEATMRWGEYEAKERLDDRGRAVFPPINLNRVIDEASETIKADLHLDITPLD
jgi:hypothetical protein